MFDGIYRCLFNHKLGPVMCLVSTATVAFIIRGMENLACLGSTLIMSFSWVFDLVKVIAANNPKFSYSNLCCIETLSGIFKNHRDAIVRAITVRADKDLRRTEISGWSLLNNVFLILRMILI